MEKQNKKQLTISLALAVVVVATTITVSAQSPAQMERVRIAAASPSIVELPLIIARLKGYLKDEGLVVERIMMSPLLAVQALVTGDLDYGTLLGGLAFASAKGAPLKIVFVNSSKPMMMFLGQPEIKSVKDLKGKAVAISTVGGMADLLIRKIVASEGLDPEKDITALRAGSTSVRVSALRAGSVAATIVSIPFNLVLERQGFTRLAYGGDFMEAATNGLGVSDRKLKENPDQIKRLIRAILKGQAYVRAHREEAIQIAMAELKIERQAAELGYDMFVKSTPKEGIPSDESIKAVIGTEVPISHVANFTLIREVLTERAR